MMQYASQGLRNTARKGSNTLVHGGHNGPGGVAPTNTQARSIHLFSPIRSSGQAALHVSPPLPGPGPRNPTNKLFSVSRNLFQKFFTHLTAPGLKAPFHLPDAIGSRSLRSSALHANTIQNRLSTAVRYSLRNNALQRQANTFLPRGPGPVPPRFGGVVEVGLGTARNFSTGRPIFQHLAENVPVAVRALYEADLDLEIKKQSERKRLVTPNAVKKVKIQEMIKPLQKSQKRKALANVEHTKPTELLEETEHYFSAIAVAPVTTYLLIPLAPTPTSRTPLPLDPLPSRLGPSQDPRLLPPLSYIGSLHMSHATHSLRVSTLFTRLDQANVWTRGVRCSAYSEGYTHRKRHKSGESDASDEGVCTILKVEFVGWSKADVRSVIGESGTGWCVLEETLHEEDEGLTDTESLSSGLSEEDQIPNESLGLGNFGDSSGMIDPSESFILPTLDFSSSFNTSSSSLSHSVVTTIPSEMENDPWVDDCYDSDSSSSWGSSPHSESSELIIDPPSSNGWFGPGHGLGPGLGFSSQSERMRDQVEPREVMFN